MANTGTIFTDLQVKAMRAGIKTRSKEATEWFRQKVQHMRTPNRQELLKNKDLSKVERPMPGQMFMYFYQPKFAKTLPYYDRFPLIIMVDEAPGGFYGLNLHYLPPALRGRFFDALMETMSDKRYSTDTNLKITYNMLKTVSKFKYFKACYKHYLTEHVRSQIVRVNSSEWTKALFLPTQQFEKASSDKVWKDSKGKY